KYQIDRRFIFCTTASSWKRQKISLRDGPLITNTFPLAGGRRSMKRQELRCNRLNRSGRLCGAVPVLDQPLRCVGGLIHCAGAVTKGLSTFDWSHLSLPPAAPLTRLQLILRGQRLCSFPGNAN